MFQAVKETKTALKSSRYQECTVVNQWWTDTYIVKTFPAVPYLSLLVSYFDATHLDTHRRESETDRMILLEQQRNCRNWSWRCIEPCAGNQWRVWLESILVYISNIINMFVWILKTCFKVVSSFEKPNWTVQSFFQIGAVSVWQQVVEKESALAQDESDLIEVPMLQHWRHEWAIVQCGTG